MEHRSGFDLKFVREIHRSIWYLLLKTKTSKKPLLTMTKPPLPNTLIAFLKDRVKLFVNHNSQVTMRFILEIPEQSFPLCS